MSAPRPKQLLEAVFRIQHMRDGRGPFRPGSEWYDEVGHDLRSRRPTWMHEFGDDAIARLGRSGETFGTGVRTRNQIFEWFSPGERVALRVFGYVLVRVPGIRVLAESPHQVLFARDRPLNVGVTIYASPAEAAAIAGRAPR